MNNDQVAKLLSTLPIEDYVYVASVYTQDPLGFENAFDNANTVGAWLVERGVHVFVPIAHSHPISLKVPKELNTHATWMAQDYPMVYRAAAIILTYMPGWEKSKGMAMEAAWAREQGKPVYELQWPLNV